MTDIDIIYNEDCLEGMKRIPDGNIDMICCDLPYGVLHRDNPDAKWDNIIPFAPLWEQYGRVIKDNGAIVLFAQGMFTAKLMLSQPKIWRYNLVWYKCRTSGFLNAHKMPLRCHEDICVFYKKLPIYNPQMEDLNGREPTHTQGKGTHFDKNRCYGNVTRFYDNVTYEKKFPRSVISIPAVHCNEGQFHPVQKPVELISYLIRTFTNPGAVVMDNCMGSGTTAVAALREKRHFIGFELNKEYYDKACKRIRLEQSQPSLF